MALVDYVYLNPGRTDQFDDAVDSLGAQAKNGGSGVGVFYITPDAGEQLGADSDPGVDAIEVSIADASPASGVEASHIRLAASEAGLAVATPGATLSLGTWITAETAVWYQWDNSVGNATYTEISLGITALAAVTP